MMPTPRHIGWVWVAMQFLLLAALVFAPALPALHASLLVGWILFGGGLLIFTAALIALGKAFTPNPLPNAHSQIVAHGIYRWIRHPRYSAVLVCALGWAMVFGGAWHYTLCVILCGFFWAKSRGALAFGATCGIRKLSVANRTFFSGMALM
jgi:protein-S-isoprenylcysteine O-methyltransferase Ste14